MPFLPCLERSRRHLPITVSFVLFMMFAFFMLMSSGRPALAGSYPPSVQCNLTTTTPEVTPGETVVLTGTGFEPLDIVTLSSEGTTLAVVHASASGAIVATVSIPATSNAAVVATSLSQSCSLPSTTPANSMRTVASVPTRDTAETSRSSTHLATVIASALGLTLLLSGLMFVLFGRRSGT